MTKRDYVMLAKAIAEESRTGGDKLTLQRLARSLGSLLQVENRKFSREIFEKATGVFDPASSAGGKKTNTEVAPAPRRLFRGGSSQPAPKMETGPGLI
jgi:hypothetical protein